MTFTVLGVLALLLFLFTIGPTVVWLLWPLVMEPLFNLPPIGWWQALGLILITSILFKSPQQPKGNVS